MSVRNGEREALLGLFGVEPDGDDESISGRWEQRNFEVVDPRAEVLQLLAVDSAAWAEGLRHAKRKKREGGMSNDNG